VGGTGDRGAQSSIGFPHSFPYNGRNVEALLRARQGSAVEALRERTIDERLLSAPRSPQRQR
jgi:hypothetical protein